MHGQTSLDEIELRDAVRRFAEREIAPHAAEFDRAEAFPEDYPRRLAEFGLFGLNLPTAWGGAGASAVALAAAVEEIAGACAATASAVTAHYLATEAILIGGGDDPRRLILPGAASGRLIGAFALTEPMAGSNPADMTSRAAAENGGFRLVGLKHYISNAGIADFFVVFAKTDPAAGTRGISAFLVDRRTPGLVVGRAEPTVGLRASRIHEVAFDCAIGRDRLIGTAGGGFKIAMATLDRGRIDIAAMALGLARAAFAATVDHAKTRLVSGQPLAANQGVQWMLADMATDLEAARGLVARAAVKRDRGESFAAAAAMAKLHASEAAGRIVDGALQLHGGAGYSRALPIERLWRDARVLRIFEGASEIQRTIIARDLLR
jgi:alkylation response protein AidB-like acyl-CoA dehydrogenase